MQLSFPALARRAAPLALVLGATMTVAAAQGDGLYFDARAKAEVRAKTAPADLPYLLDIGSRLIQPRRDTPVDFDGGRALVYLQFDEPLTTPERGRLIRMGVRLLQTYDRHTYLARLSGRTLAGLQTFKGFRGVEPVVYADRLDEALYYGDVSEHAKDGDKLLLDVWFYDDVSPAHMAHTLRALDIEDAAVSGADLVRFARVTATWEQSLLLSERPVVKTIRTVPPPPTTNNTTSQQISNVDDVQAAPFNLSGAGVNLGIWDGGPVRNDHPDLTGRVTVVEGGTNNDHATHVAGTMMGDGTNNAAAEGMAPGAPMIWSYNFGGTPWNEMLTDPNSLVITNNSWGTTLGWDFDGTTWSDTGNDGLFGQYSGTTSAWDTVVDATGLIIVKSSGNDRDDCDPNDATDCDGFFGTDGQSYDTIPHRGNAKNIITVGAVDDAQNIAGFSSSGPTDDARIKPDVVANGVGLTSTWAGGTTLPGGCDGLDYCSIGGTSMSTPTVSGICALLVERYRQEFLGASPTPEAVKALLVNGARDGGRPGPDYLFGHGIADALSSVLTIDDRRILADAVGTAEQDEFLMLVPGGQAQLSVTLAWTEPAGPLSPMPAVINDLDLELISPSNQIFYPWSGLGLGAPAANFVNAGPNAVDNVERATVNNPEQGVWRVRVRGTAVPQGDQDYALTVSHQLNLDSEPNIVVNAPLDFFETCADDFQDIRVSIFNTGGAPLFVNDIQLAGSLAFELLSPPTLPFIVPAGGLVEVTVRFAPTAGHAVGGHVGTLTIDSNDPDQPELVLPMTGSVGIQNLKTSLEAHGNFGCVALGEFRTLEYQIVNDGTCDLEIASLVRTSGSMEFTLGEQPGSNIFPLTLFPGEHVQVFFKYEPVDFSMDTSAWTLTTNDPDTPSRVFQLQGRSMPPDIAITGSTDFGVVCPDEQAERVLDICNVGKSNLEVTSVDFVAPCDDFELVNSPYPPAVADPFTPVSHDFCLPVTIRYTPTGVGVHTCTLRIVSNDPDESPLDVTVTAETPPTLIDVPDDIGFPPTVVQQIDEACESSYPFAVTNVGICPADIVNIEVVPPVGGDPNYTDFSLENLPNFPLTILPGHRVGNGQARVVFRPTAVRRFIHARVAITYVSNDPAIEDLETVYVELCGEGVNTGARLLVTENGVPVPHVDKITLYMYDDYDLPSQSSFVIEVTLDKYLQVVAAEPPCDGFLFHHEWGGETNPIVLQPGWYRVESAIGTQSPPDRSTVFYIPDVCTFLDDVVIDYP